MALSLSAVGQCVAQHCGLSCPGGVPRVWCAPRGTSSVGPLLWNIVVVDRRVASIILGGHLPSRDVCASLPRLVMIEFIDSILSARAWKNNGTRVRALQPSGV